MLEFGKINDISQIFPIYWKGYKVCMGSRHERDYIARHQKIRDNLIELIRESERACFDVSQLASQLGMDIRTVRAHLKIMEVDAVGVFMDPGEKQFCTKEGIALLAHILKLNEKTAE